MNPSLSFVIALILAWPGWLFADAGKPAVEQAAAFPTEPATGVAVSKEGRVFVNFPDWQKDHGISVAEVMKDGTLKAYPDDRWNKNDGDPARRWVCVQSVFIDDTNSLWVLDPAAPMMGTVVKGGAKLVKIDLTSNQPVQIIPFSSDIAPAHSYLNDVRIDSKKGRAYITESGLGALIVVDLHSGKARRLLADDRSTKGEPGFKLFIDGHQLRNSKTGQTPQMNADGLALDSADEWVYWHDLTGHTLWRAKTDDLGNEALTDQQLSSRIQKVAQTPAPDGMLSDPDGAIYLTDLEDNAVVRFDPNGNRITPVLKDDRLQWPDSMSWGPGGWLYVTASQIDRMPKYNEGKDKRQRPFLLLRVKVF